MTVQQEEDAAVLVTSLRTLAVQLASERESATARQQLLLASTPLFAHVKAFNRSVYEDSKAAKAEVAEARSGVDAARLNLQNLKYERNQLSGEIRKCQEFRSIYQDTVIHPLEEFRSSAPEEMRAAEGHELMLNRLRFELQERQRLEAEKQKLQGEKQAMSRENKEKKTSLEAVEKELKGLYTRAKAVEASLEAL